MPDAAVGDPGGGGNSGGGAALEASGTLLGNAFSMRCEPSYYEQTGLGSLLQCQPNTGLHMIQCRTDAANAHGVMGQVSVVVKLFRDNAAPGEINFLGDTFAGVTLGGTLDSSGTGGSTSALVNKINVTRFEDGVGAAGTFEAEWDDSDPFAHEGKVTGSFDFQCPSDG